MKSHAPSAAAACWLAWDQSTLVVHFGTFRMCSRALARMSPSEAYDRNPKPYGERREPV